MNPSKYYCWLYERRWVWLGLHRLRPRPDQNFPWIMILATPLLLTAVVLGGLSLLLWVVLSADSVASGSGVVGTGDEFISGSIAMAFWILGPAVFACGLGHTLFAWAVWNRRAAKIRALGEGEAPVVASAMSRWILGPLYVIAIGIITPLAFLVAVENVRGSLHWRGVKAELVDKGERLEIAQLLPKPVPAEENFGSLPIFANLFDYARDTIGNRSVWQWRDTNALQRGHIFRLPERKLPKPFPGKRKHATLEEWAVAFRSANVEGRVYPEAPDDADAATVVWTALQAGASDLETIRGAMDRPHAHFGLHWEEWPGTLLPHLALIKSMQQHLSLRVRVQLALNRVEPAWSDVRTGLYLAEVLRDEPLLISQLVRIAQGGIALEALSWGLEAHQWSEAQLLEFEKELMKINYLDGMAFGIEGERANMMTFFDWMAKDSMIVNAVRAIGRTDPESPYAELVGPLGTWIPSGVLRRNQANIALHHQIFLDEIYRLKSVRSEGRFATELKFSVDEIDRALVEELMKVTPYNVLMPRLAPASGKAIEKAIRGETRLLCATIGCAVERYRLSEGEYPDSLEQLVPEYVAVLPIDPMDGNPLRYARTEDDKFRIWSVGLNDPGDEGRPRSKEPDWSWP